MFQREVMFEAGIDNLLRTVVGVMREVSFTASPAHLNAVEMLGGESDVFITDERIEQAFMGFALEKRVVFDDDDRLFVCLGAFDQNLHSGEQI